MTRLLEALADIKAHARGVRSDGLHMAIGALESEVKYDQGEKATVARILRTCSGDVPAATKDRVLELLGETLCRQQQ